MHIRAGFLAGAIAAAGATGCSSSGDKQPPAAAGKPAAQAAARFAVIPPKKDSDLKLYYADGRILKGADALARMQQDGKLILWLAGNQFFAMDDVVRAFQAQNRGTDVGLITLPPGLLLAAIQKGGWQYGDKEYPGRPDIYASVNLGHLKTLKQAGLMNEYAIYMHNEMVLMVAKGNPKNIKGIRDVVRPDVRTSMPRAAWCSSTGARCASAMACGCRFRVARSASPVRRQGTTGLLRCTTGKRRIASSRALRILASSGSPKRSRRSAGARQSTR